MSEFDKSSLEGFLAEEAKKRAYIEANIGAISQVLEANARKVIGAYEAERQALLPEAQKKLTTVVIPWWQDFEESGTYQRVFDYLSQRDFWSGINPVANLSDPIVFPWPTLSLNPKEIEKYARGIIERQKGDIPKAREAATQAYKAYDSWPNLWTADFYLAGENQARHDPGFGISRWPINGGGFAYAMNASRNDIHLHKAEAYQLVIKIHPEVIIGFAEQIESGRVYQKLQESLQPRSLGALRAISREELARRQGDLYKNYLERKRARENS